MAKISEALVFPIVLTFSFYQSRLYCQAAQPASSGLSIRFQTLFVFNSPERLGCKTYAEVLPKPSFTFLVAFDLVKEEIGLSQVANKRRFGGKKKLPGAILSNLRL
jgi:hypothetical protein